MTLVLTISKPEVRKSAIPAYQVSGLIMLVPYGVLALLPSSSEISAFSYAFERAGLEWMSYIVSFCACMGIVSNVGIVLYGGSRILVAVCRERLLPPALGEGTAGPGRQSLNPSTLNNPSVSFFTLVELSLYQC